MWKFWALSKILAPTPARTAVRQWIFSATAKAQEPRMLTEYRCSAKLKSIRAFASAATPESQSLHLAKVKLPPRVFTALPAPLWRGWRNLGRQRLVLPCKLTKLLATKKRKKP